MLKTLVLTAALAGLAPTANAGGIDLRFLFDSHGKIRVGVGLPHHRVRNAHSQHRTVRSSRHQHHDHARRVWVSARSERVSHRVWIPERHASYVVPARYEYRRDECGHRVRVMVRRSYTKTRCIPGRYETRYRTVRHAGHYETRGGSRSRESNSRDSRSRRGRRSRTH